MDEFGLLRKMVKEKHTERGKVRIGRTTSLGSRKMEKTGRGRKRNRITFKWKGIK